MSATNKVSQLRSMIDLISRKRLSQSDVICCRTGFDLPTVIIQPQAFLRLFGAHDMDIDEVNWVATVSIDDCEVAAVLDPKAVSMLRGSLTTVAK